MLEAGDTDRAISRVYRASMLQPNNAETVSLLAEIQRRVSSRYFDLSYIYNDYRLLVACNVHNTLGAAFLL